jgi:UDP-glucose 4-epimerase
VASSAKLERQLGWKRNFSDLRTIVEHAWNFAERSYGVQRSTA